MAVDHWDGKSRESVGIMARQQAASEAGPVLFVQPARVMVDAGGRGMPAEQAWELAVLLVEAAERIEGQGGARWAGRMAGRMIGTVTRVPAPEGFRS